MSSHIADHEDENEIFKIVKNLVNLYINGNKDKYNAKIPSYEILKNINYKAVLKGRAPNSVQVLSLLLSNKLLNDNYDNDKDNDKDEIYQTFSKKPSIEKAFKIINDYLDNIIPQKYSNKI